MKKNILFFCGLIVFFSCQANTDTTHNNGESKQETFITNNIYPNNQIHQKDSIVIKPNPIKMTVFDDQYIRMTIPEKWEIHYSEIDSRKIYTLVAPSAIPNRNVTIDIFLDPPNPYMSGMNKTALLDAHEQDHTAGHTIVQCEILPGKSGKQLFYLVQKHPENILSPYKVSFYSPVEDAGASYAVMSSFNQIDNTTFDQLKDILPEIAKNIEIK